MAYNGSGNLSVGGDARNDVRGDQYINNYFNNPDVTHIPRSLLKRVAVNATLDAGQRAPPPKCHPETRVKVLDELDQWVRDKGITRVYWVSGSVGVGKSAIAQTFSETHQRELAAAFFFSREDTTRNTLELFVTTIAYQLCTSDALRNVVGPFVIDAIRANPRIFDTSFENQFRELVIKPWLKVDDTQRRHLPYLFVVDGIDECIGIQEQKRIMDIIDIGVMFTTPSPFLFLLLSRPEPEIHHSFITAGFPFKTLPISDTTVRFLGSFSESDLDIERFFKEKFSQLREKHRGILPSQELWPSDENIRKLVWRASGQFIFAVTVINYVDTVETPPQERLETILSTRTEKHLESQSPYHNLDLLYRQILSTCQHWKNVRLVLRFLLTPNPIDMFTPSRDSWRSLTMIAGLLKQSVADIHGYMSRLHSVIHVPRDANLSIRILHASFAEFLLDRTRSREYCISRLPGSEYCDLVAALLLRTLSAFTASYPGNPQSPSGLSAWQNKLDVMDELTKTSLYWWPEYCLRVTSPSGDLIKGLNAFDPYAVAAMLLVRIRDVSGRLQKWKECLDRAKSLGNLAPKRFVQKLEAFLRGFDVSIPDISQPSRRTFSTKDGDFGKTLGEFIRRTSQESTLSTKPYPMVLPIAKKRSDAVRQSRDDTTKTSDDVAKELHSAQPLVEEKDADVLPGVDHAQLQISGPPSDPSNIDTNNPSSPPDSGRGQATQGNGKGRRIVGTGHANGTSSHLPVSETNAQGSRAVIRAASQGNHNRLEDKRVTPTTHSSTGPVFDPFEGHTIATGAYTPPSSQVLINDEVKARSTRGGTHETSHASTSESPAQQLKTQDDVLKKSSSTQAQTEPSGGREMNNAGPSAAPSPPSGVSDPTSQPLSTPDESHLPSTSPQAKETPGDQQVVGQQSKDGFCAWLKRLFCCC
ncbi:hypothetical protein VNI00_018197 [Paramarasmius palmivorus]|uniref:Nephrocystin 3-like N-terminal domain-containing protein n=1 Tax=Paramarasmius palmivorus TaxID=297713 RepID=A0AAW0AZX9_9AGAR